MLDTLPPLANALSQPPLGSTSSNSSTSSLKTSNYHYLSTFLSTLTPLTSTHPILFAPHLQNLLSFLPALILPPVDCGPTPTVGRPFPAGSGSRQGAFIFPPPDSSSSSSPTDEDGSPSSPTQEDEDKDERSTLRLSALEFMISLSEARPNMVRKVSGWTEIIVRACLEGMGEFDEEETSGLEGWLKEDVGYFFDFFIFCFRGSRYSLFSPR